MVDEKEWWTGTKARVFVSCGQARPSERKAASAIDRELGKLGFCPYVAIEAHSSKGLTENIFSHLATADYFLFVDFRRDQIGKRHEGRYRGSLFSNQELGIASFIQTDLLPFVQNKIRREGILGAIQGNAISFPYPKRVPDLVRQYVWKEKWDPGNRRELRIEPGLEIDYALLPQIFRVISQGEYVYYHLRLRNLHSRILATNCIIQIVGARGPSFTVSSTPDVIEMKFKHITSPQVILPAGARRSFDAIVVRKNENGPPFAIPGIVHPTYVDSERLYHQYAMTTPGQHTFDLRVHSSEFGSSLQRLRFYLGEKWEQCRLEVMPPERPEGILQ
jgi:hypothetical protein